jgi:hypothetical protein
MDISAVLNAKLHENILGPVIPQGPSMLPEGKWRWGFIGAALVGEVERGNHIGTFGATVLLKWS